MQESNYWLCLDSRVRKSWDALVLRQHFLCRDLVFKRAFSPFKSGRENATCSAVFTGKDKWTVPCFSFINGKELNPLRRQLVMVWIYQICWCEFNDSLLSEEGCLSPFGEKKRKERKEKSL